MGGKEPEESSLANDIIKLIFKKTEDSFNRDGTPSQLYMVPRGGFPIGNENQAPTGPCNWCPP